MAGKSSPSTGSAHEDDRKRCFGHALLPRVRQAKPDTAIVASGFSCREQIEQLTGRKTVHFAEIVAEAMGLPLSRRASAPSRGRPWLTAGGALAAGLVIGGLVIGGRAGARRRSGVATGAALYAR